MNNRTLFTAFLAGTLLGLSAAVSAQPPRHYGPPPGHHHPPPPPPAYRYDGSWVAPAIIGGIGLGYLLSQPPARTVIIEQPAPVYRPRCDETTTYDRYGNRTTTRTCY